MRINKKAIEKFIDTMFFKGIVDFEFIEIQNNLYLYISVDQNKFDINSENYDENYANRVNLFTRNDLTTAVNFFKNDNERFNNIELIYENYNTEILDAVVKKLSSVFSNVRWVSDRFSPYVRIEIVSKMEYKSIFGVYESLGISHYQYLTDRISGSFS